jgi:hypothetical protein
LLLLYIAAEMTVLNEMHCLKADDQYGKPNHSMAEMEIIIIIIIIIMIIIIIIIICNALPWSSQCCLARSACRVSDVWSYTPSSYR